MDSISLPMRGGCHCGAVRYDIAQAPLLVYACHCTDCQRITGSAFSIGIVVPDAAFRLTGRAPRTAPHHVADSGRIKARWVCPDCGTWLFGDPRPGTPHPGQIRIVRGGTLDDASWLRPTMHYWTRSKQSWVVLSDDAVLFDTQPDSG
jgi:hypothetical protein